VSMGKRGGFAVTTRAALFVLLDRRDTVNHCHLERSPKELATEDESKDPENVSSAMLIQGVLTMDCPRKRISRPQVSARSRQRGLVVSTSAIFFSRRQRFSCFSLLIACAAWSEGFVIDKAVNLVFFCEAFNSIHLVLHDAAVEVFRDVDVGAKLTADELVMALIH